jgi:hypothetical protein
MPADADTKETGDTDDKVTDTSDKDTIRDDDDTKSAVELAEAALEEARQQARDSSERQKSASEKIANDGRVLKEKDEEIARLNAQNAALLARDNGSGDDDDDDSPLDPSTLDPNVLAAIGVIADDVDAIRAGVESDKKERNARERLDVDYKSYEDEFGMERQDYDLMIGARASGDNLEADRIFQKAQSVNAAREQARADREASEEALPRRGGEVTDLGARSDDDGVDPVKAEADRINAITDEAEKSQELLQLLDKGETFADKVYEQIDYSQAKPAASA